MARSENVSEFYDPTTLLKPSVQALLDDRYGNVYMQISSQIKYEKLKEAKQCSTIMKTIYKSISHPITFD